VGQIVDVLQISIISGLAFKGTYILIARMFVLLFWATYIAFSKESAGCVNVVQRMHNYVCSNKTSDLLQWSAGMCREIIAVHFENHET
jgi:hypothetical protein